MLIIIHNLPHQFRYNDIKSLIHSKCGLKDIILDNLLPEGGGKKVTIGVADEGDAAMLVRNLNGVYLQDSQLFVEVVRQKHPDDQPYHNTTSNAGNNILNMKNNQATAQIYQSQSVQQMMASQLMASQMMASQMRPSQMEIPQTGTPKMGTPQMGTQQMGTQQMGVPQMVPPPIKEDNFKTTSSMNLNYVASQTSQFGYDMQQQYSNTNMVPALISYPRKQNIDYDFGIGNKQYSNQGQSQSWGNFNANSFNTNRQNDYASYSSSNQSRFDQILPQSKVDTSVDDKRGLKRKRSESPVRRQSYSHQSGSDWSRRDQTNSGWHDSSYNDQVPSRNFSRYSFSAGSSSRRDEAPVDRIKSPWNVPPSQLSKLNQRDVPKSDFSNRKSNYNDSKKSKWNNKSEIANSTFRNRAFNEPKKQSKADTKSLNTNSIYVPTNKVLQIDKCIRNQSTKTITRAILDNALLNKTTDNVPDGHIYDRMLRAVKARVILLTDSLYALSREFCFNKYREKFPESDDQHFYNVIVNRCKRHLRLQAQKEILPNEPASNNIAANSNPALVSVDTKEQQHSDPSMKLEKPQAEASVNMNPGTSAPVLKSDAAHSRPPVTKPMGNKPKIQVHNPGSAPKCPKGNKSVFKENKRESKLQFQQGPSAIDGDPVIKRAVEKEIDFIEKMFLQVCQESLQTADSTEKIFFELFENRSIGRKVNEAFQVHILRRMGCTDVKPLLRITVSPKGLKKDSLMDFLKGYGILNLRKSDKGMYYIATCQSYKTFDKLCEMENVAIGDRTVSFRPMHLGGPPDKKAIRNKKLSTKFAKAYNKIKNTHAVESFKPRSDNVSKETDNVDKEASNLPDDTECKEVVDIKDHVKAVDVKHEEEKHTDKLEKNDERTGENKENDVTIKESEVRDSGVKNDVDWPNEEDGEDWMENTDVKEAIHGDVKIENNTEKDVKSDKKEIEEDNETVIIKPGNWAESTDGTEVVHEDEKIKTSADNGFECEKKEIGDNFDNEEHVDTYEVDDLNDINMDDVDDDDLEDY